jgi:histone deacetylase 1/2
MSIITNQYYDIPSYENGFEYAIPGKPDSRRRFFQSVARWDARYQKVAIPGRDVRSMPKHIYGREEFIARTPRTSEDDGEGGEVVGSVEEDDEASGAMGTDSGNDTEASVMLE